MIHLYLSNRDNKKYVVIINGKSIYFGDNNYENYTMHKDLERINRYLLRHKHDHINDIYKPGFWSWHIP